MKKIIALITLIAVALSLCACGASLSPTEKIEKYITKNGRESKERLIVDFPEIASAVAEQEFTVAAMSGDYAKNQTCQLIKENDKVYLEIVDEATLSNGMKMERIITIDLEGKYYFSNGIKYNSSFMGVKINGEVPVETYTKGDQPVITSSETSEGANVTDAVKKILKQYVDFSIDCLGEAVNSNGMKLTLSDIGFKAYK